MIDLKYSYGRGVGLLPHHWPKANDRTIYEQISAVMSVLAVEGVKVVFHVHVEIIIALQIGEYLLLESQLGYYFIEFLGQHQGWPRRLL